MLGQMDLLGFEGELIGKFRSRVFGCRVEVKDLERVGVPYESGVGKLSYLADVDLGILRGQTRLVG